MANFQSILAHFLPYINIIDVHTVHNGYFNNVVLCTEIPQIYIGQVLLHIWALYGLLWGLNLYSHIDTSDPLRLSHL